MKRFFLLYLLTSLIISGTVLQFSANAASPSSILVGVVPENPAPGDNVTVSLSSYANDLDSVLISWSVNGKAVTSGIGKKSFFVTAPAAGTETDITATTALPDGSIDTRIVIRPTIMVLLWQANDSYVPPFYKGKALPTRGSDIKIVAMPEIKTGYKMLDPLTMTYAWKKDYNNDQSNSGYGKNFYTYTNDYLTNSNNLDVVASTTDQKYSSEANINLGTSQPKIVFYKNDAVLGTLWEQALSDGYKITGNEIMEADPYFISPADIRIPTLTWAWSINDNSVNGAGPRKNLIPLAVQPGVSGTSKISLDIESTDKIFETANKTINVQF
jgi:hypothetical protein